MEKCIEGFSNYTINTKGTVTNKETGKVLKSYPIKGGYLAIGLYKKGKEYKKLIHRLVAEAFIPNLNNKPCVDHINMNKKDNTVENLRWCTVEENNNFAFKIMSSQQVIIMQPLLVNGVKFESMTKAAKHIAGIENKNYQTLLRDIRRWMNSSSKQPMTRYNKKYVLTKI